jgi:hypothetical protein
MCTCITFSKNLTDFGSGDKSIVIFFIYSNTILIVIKVIIIITIIIYDLSGDIEEENIIKHKQCINNK